MNSQIVIGLRTAATIFAIVCLAQMLRLLTQADFMVAGHHVPFWPSGIAAVVSGGLSVWLWRLSNRINR